MEVFLSFKFVQWFRFNVVSIKCIRLDSTTRNRLGYKNYRAPQYEFLSALFCHFISLRTSCFPHHVRFRRPRSVFSLNMRDQVSHPFKTIACRHLPCTYRGLLLHAQPEHGNALLTRKICPNSGVFHRHLTVILVENFRDAPVCPCPPCFI
jgi:hypothetical protein